jgi:deoxycytidine triphosphate deaminase
MGVLTRGDSEGNPSGNIEIDPFEEDQVGPGSIDLRLGNEFRVLRN